MKRVIWVLVCAVGCAQGNGGELADCDADDLSGMGQAEVDGLDWSISDGTWSEAGSSVQFNFESDLDISMNLRGIRSGSGDSVADLVANGSFPFVVDLSGEDGSGSIMDQRNGLDSYASSQPGGSGSMSVLGRDGAALTVCFGFDAVNADGVIMQVRNGQAEVNSQL